MCDWDVRDLMNVLDRRSSGAMVGMRIKDGSSPSTRSIQNLSDRNPGGFCVQCRATQGSLFQRRVPGCLHSFNKGWRH